LKRLRLRADDPVNTPDEPAEATHTVVGERSIASVNRGRSLQSRLSNLLAMGLMAALGIGLLGWYYSRTLARPAQTQRAAQAASVAQAQGELALPALGRVDAPATAMNTALTEQMLGPAPVLPDEVTDQYLGQESRGVSDAGSSYAAYEAPTEKSPTQLALERRLSGPAFTAVTDHASTVAATMPSPSASGSTGASTSPGSVVPTSAVATLLQPSTTVAVSAQVLPTQRLLLPKGAFIDCTLETAIDSSLPGLTTCITATDTFGADGAVVLLERGTKLVGETRGEVQQGSSRLFVLWTEARTPTGVVVPLASPGTDELGRSGLAGAVNRHFMDRFGAAILVSIIDGVIQSAVQSQRGSGGTVVVNPASTQEILTEVLKSTINIPPTITKQNGDRIQILVARDLDFRSVYELRSVNAAR